MSEIVIRRAEAGDKQAWLGLWRGYLTFYGAGISAEVTETTWSRIIDPIVPVFTLLATADDRRAGFATCILHPRTWAIEPACYLEDLFVEESQRGRGIGRRLIDDLIAMGKRDGWTNLYWHTNSGNETARRLYDRYDKADDFVRYRLPLKG
ncbi:MAG: GNAT family N-acetyltransferase [Rhizobiaceae bacterium]|nr:GNAT family N-acetyltransferase [Rhizobiaceae bacterium]|tara:strand:+ start:73 stop:525 length:453 start_codon:yes stop_codon:yes gene_type:complete